MNELFLILITTFALLLVALLLMGFRVLFVKGGKFPNSHIDANPQLQKRGIHCAHHSAKDTENKQPLKHTS